MLTFDILSINVRDKSLNMQKNIYLFENSLIICIFADD